MTPYLPTLAGLLAGLGCSLLVLSAADGIATFTARVRELSGFNILHPWAPRAGGRAAAAIGRFLAGRRTIAPDRLALPPAVRAILASLRRPSPLLIAPLPAGVALAIAARDAVLSPYLGLLGLAVSVYMAYRRTLQGRRQIADQVKRLVDSFVGLYRVNPTTFTTLGLACDHLKPGPVREIVEEAVRHYQATRNAHAALQRLYTVPDPYLWRFALILDQAGERGTEEIAGLLGDLSARLRRQWTTRLAAQGVFASIRGTLAVMAGAAVAVMAAAATIPLWREVYTAATGRRAMFMLVTLMALVTAAYFDRRMRLDEDTFL